LEVGHYGGVREGASLGYNWRWGIKGNVTWGIKGVDAGSGALRGKVRGNIRELQLKTGCRRGIMRKLR
jgi:hypothetical protein